MSNEINRTPPCVDCGQPTSLDVGYWICKNRECSSFGCPADFRNPTVKDFKICDDPECLEEEQRIIEQYRKKD